MGQGRHPLSSSQNQLWFLNQMFPDKPIYNTPLATRLRGPLDVAALRGALTAVVQHNEVLRVTFGAEDGTPFQQVFDVDEVDLPVRDVNEADIDRLMDDEVAIPMDLTTGPLYRFALLRIAPDDHVLIYNFHHIVVDGWSSELINQQIPAAYRALIAGQPVQLPPPSVSYFDYVEQNRVDPATEEEHLEFWEQRLAGLQDLDLPTDRPRPTNRSMRGDRLLTTIDSDLVAGLQQLAQQLHMSLFAPLAAALEVVLARYTDQPDIPLGITMFGRPESALENVIGFFSNMSILRGDLSGDPTVSEIIEQAADGIFDAIEHHLPFERLVDRIAPTRDPNRNPLFQVCVQILDANTSGRGLDLDGCTAESLTAATGTSRFDMTLIFTQRAGTLLLDIEYSTDLFDRWRIEAMVSHLEQVLRAVVADPSQRLSQIPMLTEAERAQLLAFGHGEPSSRDPRPVHRVFADIAAEQPDLLAATCRDRSITYGELNRQADRLARQLRSMGVRHEQIVAVAMDHDLDTLVALLGILKAGAAYTCIDLAQPANRLSFILADTAAPVVITRTSLADRLPDPEGYQVLCLDGDWTPPAPDEPLEEWASGDSLLYIIYTSGSTGQPKGVPLEHRAFMSFARSYQRDLGWRPGERIFQMRPLTFDMTHGEILGALTAGAAVSLVPEELVTDPQAMSELIRKEEPTYLSLPVALMALMDAGPYPSVRTVVHGGETIAGELVNKWHLPGRKFFNFYGPTEAAVICTSYECERTTWVTAPPVGKPQMDRDIYLVDRFENLVPVGVPGELIIGGDEGLARGYHNRPDLTEKAFVPDPFVPGRRVYRSGDLARWNLRGDLEFIGRRDSQIKLRGQRIELEEIEAVLAAHPNVGMAAVVVATDPQGDQQLVGFVTPSEAGRPEPEELRSHVSSYLPRYMVPVAWQVLERFPLTPAKKIDRKALQVPEWTPDESDVEVDEPQTETEAQLIEIFANVLGLTKVRTDHDFFGLGGSSVQSMRLISRINARFSIKLSVRELYGNATIATVAGRIDELRAAATSGA